MLKFLKGNKYTERYSQVYFFNFYRIVYRKDWPFLLFLQLANFSGLLSQFRAIHAPARLYDSCDSVHWRMSIGQGRSFLIFEQGMSKRLCKNWQITDKTFSRNFHPPNILSHKFLKSLSNE